MKVLITSYSVQQLLIKELAQEHVHEHHHGDQYAYP